MNINDAEHAKLIEQFELDYPYAQKDKEPKELWAKGSVYCHGETNNLFLAYRRGYSFGKCVEAGHWNSEEIDDLVEARARELIRLAFERSREGME